MLQEMLRSSWLVTLLAIVAALVISGLLIAAADEQTRQASSYFFSRPYDMLWYAWDAIRSSYVALFRGAVFDFEADSFVRMIRPLTETMVWSTPLIFAGLGLAVGFRSGMFNIGAQGQVLMGAAASAYVGFTFSAPGPTLLVLAVLAAIVIGGIWGGIAGFLKARTGANEVIVTIMLNWIAVWLVSYLLTTSVLRPIGNRPISPAVHDNAMFPNLLPEPFRISLAFPLALLAAFGVWWLMERSTLGFKFRAVGANMDAARTAGIKVPSVFVWVMVVGGLLAGLGGSSIVLGTEGTMQASTAGSVGFDAITVALLGRSKPLGTVGAALLFGALRAGSPFMKTVADTPTDIVLVIQAVIVLFIAAPPLVRRMFFLPHSGLKRKEALA
nr:ABC transporter permease [Pseudactinotalea sp. HY160]